MTDILEEIDKMIAIRSGNYKGHVSKAFLDAAMVVRDEQKKNGNPTWQTSFHRSEIEALKIIRKLVQTDRERVLKALEAIAVKPLDDPYCDDFVRLSKAVSIIQNKEGE